MRRVREERKLLCVGVDLPIDAGYQRCTHCTRCRWWLLKYAFNHGVPQAVPILEDVADPGLRW